MQIRHLRVENYRGVSKLEWRLGSRLVALIGAGDSCKTTILEAIELVLSPRWNPPTSDNDFFEADAQRPLLIEATVSGLPKQLLSDRKFGLDLRGVAPDGSIRDEPEADDELALTIRFTLSADLEPSWGVVNDRLPEARPIGARDRELLGAARLGGSPDRHFSWGRGSALAKSTSDPGDVNQVLADAQRAMRTSVSELSLDDLAGGVETAQSAARRMGAGRVAESLKASLSADAVGARSTGLTLHSGPIPLDRSGLGTKRLVALGLQRLATPEGAIQLVDEFEAGLEPFRTRHLLAALAAELDVDSGGEQGQVVLTTHSPIVLAELQAEHVHVVRREPDGTVSVTQVPEELRPMLRSVPEAFLGRRVIVCEGKTEIGILRGLAPTWAAQNEDAPLAHSGTLLADGQGADTGKRAAAFLQLGYEVAVLADSDRELSPTLSELELAGATTSAWSGQMATEGRICTDLPRSWLIRLVDLIALEHGAESTRDSIFSKLGQDPPQAMDADTWISAVDEDTFRAGLAKAMGKGKWLKRVDLGQSVGEMLGRAWPDLEGTDLRKKLEAIETWAYAP